MWVAQVDTGHFSFTAIGATEEAALRSMQRGLARHTEQYGGALTTWSLADLGVNTVELQEGQCARDGSVMG